MTIQYPRRRNSLRYPGYDYAQPGAVFVTVCTAGKQRLFGSVEDGQMIHSPSGAMVATRWQAIPDRFPDVEIDAFVVMPDHIHGIVLCGTAPDDATLHAKAGDVVRWVKTTMVKAYRNGVETAGWPAYDRHLWQRDYHDRIVRSDADFAAIRAYIEGNPGRWWDKHGNNTSPDPIS